MIQPKDKKKFIAAQAIGKMQVDPSFMEEFQSAPEEALKYISKEIEADVSEEEIKEIKAEVDKLNLPMPFLPVEEIKALIYKINNRAEAGYQKVQGMSDVLFKLGIIIIAAVFVLDIYGIFTEMNWQILLSASGVLGGIGIGTIYESTYKLPDKVKDSVADLVQIQLVFIGYLDQLSILMAQKGKNVDESIKIVREINNATENSVIRIQTYCETGELKISGAKGKAGTNN